MRTTKRSVFFHLFIFAIIDIFAVPALAQVFYYHGRILDPSGNPVTASNVDFRVEIRTPGPENCLLYSETQNKNLSSSGGYFTIGVNDGSGSASGFSLIDTFRKTSFTFGAGACDSGNSYTGSAGDGRKWVLYFNLNDGNGWDSFPPEKIDRAPFAIESMSVGGFQAQNLLRVENAGVPQSVSSITSANFTELLALIAGTSTQYMKPNGSANLNTTGNITAGSISGTTVGTNSLQIYRADNANKVTIQVPASLSPNYTLTLPSSAGSSGQVLTTDGSGALSWTTVNTAVSNQASLGSAKIWIGDGAGKAQEQNVNGDASLSNTGMLTLSSTGVTAGSYAKVTVDSKGRVTSGSSLAASDIPSLDWSKIATGKPTTLAGYGITDSVSSSLTSGQVFVGNGSNVATSRFLNISDIKSTVSGAFFNVSGSCAAGQTLTYVSASDTLSCQAYSITSSQVTSALGYTPADGSNAVAKAGDTMTGTLNLPSNGLVVGTTQLVASSGNVGIGTSAPSERLDLGGGNIKMGHEIVQNTGVAQTLSVTCPGSKRVISGGCRSNTTVTLWDSYPSSISTWTCYYNGIAMVTAYAICADMR